MLLQLCHLHLWLVSPPTHTSQPCLAILTFLITSVYPNKEWNVTLTCVGSTHVLVLVLKGAALLPFIWPSPFYTHLFPGKVDTAVEPEIASVSISHWNSSLPMSPMTGSLWYEAVMLPHLFVMSLSRNYALTQLWLVLSVKFKPVNPENQVCVVVYKETEHTYQCVSRPVSLLIAPKAACFCMSS